MLHLTTWLQNIANYGYASYTLLQPGAKMILHCQNCDTKYATTPEAIGPQGRTVRCAKCGHSWFQAPPPVEEPPAPVADIPPAFLEMVEEAIPASKPVKPEKSAAKAPLPLVASVAVLSLVTLFLALVAFRSGVMTALPASKHLYATLGMADTTGLVIADLTFKKMPSTNYERYAIAGNIVNESNETKPVPVLRVTLVNEEGGKLQYWDFTDEKEIKPKEVIAFRKDKLESRFKAGVGLTVELGNPFELLVRK